VSVRIDRFELRAFGPFTQTVLDLRGSPGSLHLICGPNEVGKSTAQRAIGDFLFGIPPRSHDNQLHAYRDMQLAAVLTDASGARHELVRRKGARSTLLGCEGTPVDEGRLESMLGGISREAFMAMFSITHESLVVGGQQLLAAGGEVGESLFSASVGASSLHRIREQLDADAASLFKPRASSSLIMQSRARLEDAEARLRDSTLRASTFLENERELRSTGEECSELAERLRIARAQQSGRERTRTVVPLLTERDRVRQELADLGHVPPLPGDVTERRVRASDRVSRGELASADAQQRIQALDGEITALGNANTLPARESGIRELVSRVPGIREIRVDLDAQAAKLALASDLAAHALVDVRADVGLDTAGELLLDARQRQRIEAALESRARLAAQLERAEQEASDAEAHARELRAQLDRTPAPADTTALELAATEALAEGPLEQQLREAESEHSAAEEALAVALSALTPPVALPALTAGTWPSAATLERFSDDHDRLSERAAKLAERRERLETERRQLREDRARLSLVGDVPTVEELSFARSRRDRDWGRIRQRLEGELAIEVSPENMERGIQLADELADTLRRHAGFAAQAADLDLRDGRLQTEFEALAGLIEQLTADRNAHELRWQEIWTAARLTPLTPREMAQWLRDRATVLERSLAVNGCSRSIAALRERRDQVRRALVEALSASGSRTDAQSTLTHLLALAQATLETAHTQRASVVELSRDLQAAERTAGRQRAAARGLHHELEAWQVAWGELIGACGWPADVAHDEARPLLATLEELSLQLREMEQRRTRVLGIQRRISAFEQDTAAMLADLAPELGTWPALDAVTELSRRLDSAIERQTRGQELERERARAEAERARAATLVQDARAELGELLGLAGVREIDELVAVEARAVHHAQLSARLPELERQITAAGGAPLAQLIERNAGVDLDMLDADARAAEEEIAALEERRSESDQRFGELDGARKAMERAGGAAAAGQGVEQQLAELRGLVERYLRIFIAAWALREAIDQYRRDHKDPLLRRADELFPQLTCGSFSGLEADFGDDDEPVLTGVRPSGDRVRVEQMSTGTREQLYLALRLASLERHVELHGPMPVVLDDVVLHSDPRRKTAILRALAELGRSTQVITFSHDPQIVALAQEHLDPALITIHELGSAEIPEALHPAVGTADVSPIRRTEAA
jgi:uncharacterized protein YhaN